MVVWGSWHGCLVRLIFLDSSLITFDPSIGLRGIVKLFEVFEDQKSVYMVMDRISWDKWWIFQWTYIFKWWIFQLVMFVFGGAGGGFKQFFIFIPIWGRFPFWRAYFSIGWFNHQLVMKLMMFCCFYVEDVSFFGDVTDKDLECEIESLVNLWSCSQGLYVWLWIFTFISVWLRESDGWILISPNVCFPVWLFWETRII